MTYKPSPKFDFDNPTHIKYNSIALILEHKDVRMLFRYTHLKAEDIVGKIN